jgi:hypothetical protein
MKKRKTKTKLLANLLMRKSKIVKDIFELGAKSTPVPEIVKIVNEYWEMERRWNVRLTDHYVWCLFHRKPPFQNPDFYRDVMEEHKTAVAGRLYSTTPSFTLDDSKDEGEVSSEEKKKLLADLLAASVDGNKAMQAVIDAGLDPEAAVDWVNITMEVMYRAEVVK